MFSLPLLLSSVMPSSLFWPFPRSVSFAFLFLSSLSFSPGRVCCADSTATSHQRPHWEVRAARSDERHSSRGALQTWKIRVYGPSCPYNRFLVNVTRFLVKYSILLVTYNRFLVKCNRFLIKCNRFLVKCSRFLVTCTRFAVKCRRCLIDSLNSRAKHLGPSEFTVQLKG